MASLQKTDATLATGPPLLGVAEPALFLESLTLRTLGGAIGNCYRKVIEFVRAHPDNYDPDFATTFQRLIAKLDPPAATG